MTDSGKGTKGGVMQLCWTINGRPVEIILISYDLKRDLKQIAKPPADAEVPHRNRSRSRRRKTTGPMNKFQWSKRQRKRRAGQKAGQND